MYIKLFSLLLISIFLSTSISLSKSTLFRTQRSGSSKTNRSSFRYIIFQDSLLHDGRVVYVLLDDKSFSEKTLKELFQLLSRRFPEPDQLHVAVFTSLEQIPTPEEADNIKSPNANDDTGTDVNLEHLASAVYIRWNGNESFKYTSNAKNGVEKTIILKGVDMLNRKK